MSTQVTTELLSIIHDINSPLCALRGLLKGEKKDEDLEKIAYKRFIELSNKIKEHYFSTNEEKFKYLLDSIENSVALKEMEYPKVIFSVQIQPDLRDLVFDFSAEDLERTISNILNNSVEAGATQICLKIASNKKHLQIKVIDNGNGFYADEIKEIHKGSGHSTKKNGSGIGLSSGIDFIKAHGGGLQILSTPYVGTNIVMSFPREKFDSLDFGPTAS